ncbi:MAG: 3-isopropylmalate dehydrogenase [Acidobacteriota bacterium]|nr:3-isopropylmalate dehydrogenase [Acidobacteriota bacterium]
MDDKTLWHPAFYESALVTFDEYKGELIFESEHQLVSGPLEIDMLIIKKKHDVPIRKAIAEIFRKHNIIEYKSPDVSLSVDDFYKAYAYVCLYKTLERVEITDLTLSFVLTAYPRKLTRHLEQTRGYTVVERHPGIYDVKGDILPMQIIESKRLEGDENFWLRNLGAKLSVDRLNDIFRMRGEKGAGYNLNAYMFAVMNANAATMEANMRVSPTLMRVIEKSGLGAKLRAAGEIAKAQAIARNALKMNMPPDDISTLTGMSTREIKRLRKDGSGTV